MGRLWGPRARPGMTFVGPSPPASVVPVHIGKIDSPTPGERFVKGSLTVRGWTCFSAGPVSHAEVFLGDETLGSARVGVRRSDVAATIDYPYAGFSGFELTLTTEAVRAVAGIGDSEVRVLVEGLAGRTFWPEPVPIRLLPPQSIEELLEPDLGNIDTPAFGESRSGWERRWLGARGWVCRVPTSRSLSIARTRRSPASS